MDYITGSIPQGTSNELIINIGSTCWSFRKSGFMKLYPESLIGLTIFQDPTVKELTLTHSDLSPTAVGILYIILEEDGEFTPHLDELKKIFQNEKVLESIHKSSRYLLVPELDLFSSIHTLEQIRMAGYKTMIGQSYMNTMFRGYIRSTPCSERSIPYLNYLMTRSKITYDDELIFLDSILKGDLLIVQKMVEYKRVNPLTVDVDVNYLKMKLGNLENKRILEDPGMQTVLGIASIILNSEILEWLLTHTPLRDDTSQALRTAIAYLNVDSTQILLSHHQYTDGKVLADIIREHGLVHPPETGDILRQICQLIYSTQSPALVARILISWGLVLHPPDRHWTAYSLTYLNTLFPFLSPDDYTKLIPEILSDEYYHRHPEDYTDLIEELGRRCTGV